MKVHQVLQEPPGTVTVDGPAVPLDVATPGQQPELTFTGQYGESIDVVATNVTTSDYQGCAWLYLDRPPGERFGLRLRVRHR